MTTTKKIILISAAIASYASAEVTSIQSTDLTTPSPKALCITKPDTVDYVDPKKEHAKYQQKKATANAAAKLSAEETAKKPQLRDLRGRFTTVSNLLDDLSAELKQSTPDFETSIKLLERIGVSITASHNTYHLVWKAKDTKDDLHKGCHKPHGAQLKKGDKAAWVITMKDMVTEIRSQN